MLSDTAAGRATVLGLKAARSGDTDPKHAAESTLQSLDLVRWRQPRTCRRVLPPEKLMHNYRTNLRGVVSSFIATVRSTVWCPKTVSIVLPLNTIAVSRRLKVTSQNKAEKSRVIILKATFYLFIGK